jgi:MoaA/NifB/PqqE/SkfB family radical SAM enzyme
MGPTGQVRVAQIHPTRQCNLRCLHCYASSSPQITETLNFELLKSAITDLAAENYNWISFSGGEPTAYVPLPVLLRHAKRLTLKTMLVTNGIMLNQRRLDELAPLTDLMVLSLDGLPESHNKLRGSDKAFEMMASRLPLIRERQIPFGFIFTLTRHNLNELPWVMEFALAEGAKLLQIHPLERVGSAATNLAGSVPDALEGAYAYLLQQELQKRAGDKLALQLNLVHSDVLKDDPRRFYAEPGSIDPDLPLGEVISPLVIESDGTVVPMQYGFPRRFALGNLYQASLRTLSAEWRQGAYRQFEAICGQVHQQATESEPHFFNWYELLGEMAREFPATQELAPPEESGLWKARSIGSGNRAAA